MTIKRTLFISISVCVIMVVLGRVSLAVDFGPGAALLFPGMVVEMIRIGGVHGSSHSKFLTEFCLVGASFGVWGATVLVLLCVFEAIMHFIRRKNEKPNRALEPTASSGRGSS